MSDLLSRLRDWPCARAEAELMDEAAAEIERLTAALNEPPRDMTDHRDKIIEAMARAICNDRGMCPCGTSADCIYWRSEGHDSDAAVALDALTTGPLFEEMVKLAQKAYALKAADPDPGFSALMDAALRAALGAREAG